MKTTYTITLTQRDVDTFEDMLADFTSGVIANHAKSMDHHRNRYEKVIGRIWTQISNEPYKFEP